MRRNRRGIALITALAILAIVGLLVVGTVFTSTIESWTTRNDTTSTQAYDIAHAGLERFKAISFQTFRFYLDNLQQYGPALGTGAICGNLLEKGLDLNRNYVIGASDGDLVPGHSLTESYGGGSYTITFQPTGADVVLTSVGTIHGAKATVQMVFRPKNAGLFSNALFAGQGSGGKYFNGGAEVWGSIYVQGDTSVSPPPTVINTNGNFTMHNYYDSTELASLMGNRFTVDQLKAMLGGGTATDQKDLCARLRVGYGQVAVGGSTQLGDTSAPSGYKASLAGVNVYRGQQDISVSGSTDINADNYPDGNLAYDLSKSIRLPNLLPTGTTGATPCKSDSSESWQGCLVSKAQTYDATDPTSNPGGCDLSPVTSGNTIDFATTPVDCTYSVTNADGSTQQMGFSYSYNATTGNWDFKVFGPPDKKLINFAGYDLHFARNVAANFSGRATIMAMEDGSGNGGDITIDGDVLPASGFPNTDMLGMIAQHDLTMTGANQTNLASGTQTAVGLFYAGNQATIEKGGVVIGSVLANEVSTTSGNAGQTSKVIQVPGVEYNPSPGFTDLPNDVLATFQILSYERR